MHGLLDFDCDVPVMTPAKPNTGSIPTLASALETCRAISGMNKTVPVFMQLRGKERSKQQFEDLFEASGFKLKNCQSTRGPMWFITAVPAESRRP